MATEAKDFGMLIDATLHQIFDAIGGYSKFGQLTETWLASKKLNYSGSSYHEQIEKNAVYLIEGSSCLRGAITKYLIAGEPRLQESQIQSYIDQVSIQAPLQLSPDLVSYIRGYLAERPMTVSNWDWDKLRHMRQSISPSEYLQELELLCRIFQTASNLTTQVLRLFIHPANSMAGVAANLQLYELNDVLQQRFYFWANVCIGNIKYNT
jgi:hypothetical protein